MNHTEQDAINAARRMFPLSSEAQKVSKSYSHDVFIVKTEAEPSEVVVRFSNGNKEEFNLAKEIRANKIMEDLGLPVPKILLHNKEKNPFEFVILSKLEGQDLDVIWPTLSEEEQKQIAHKMGEIIGKIHQIKLEAYGLLNENGIDNGSDISAFSLKKVGEMPPINRAVHHISAITLHDLGSLSAFKTIDKKDVKDIANYIFDNASVLETQEEPTLIHGDFEYRNIKVQKINDEWMITGLLDFEYAAANMREYDFIKLHRFGFLTQTHLKEGLLAGYSKYQSIHPNFEERVKFLRFTRDIGFMLVLLKAGDINMAEKVLNNIRDLIKNPL